MPKLDVIRTAALDAKLTAMQRTMMRPTNGQQVIGVMAAALGAEIDVVEIEEGCIPTAWNPATLMIAP